MLLVGTGRAVEIGPLRIVGSRVGKVHVAVCKKVTKRERLCVCVSALRLVLVSVGVGVRCVCVCISACMQARCI